MKWVAIFITIIKYDGSIGFHIMNHLTGNIKQI